MQPWYSIYVNMLCVKHEIKKLDLLMICKELFPEAWSNCPTLAP